MAKLTVIHFEHAGAEHNWKVMQDGFELGTVHCNGDGNDFGGCLTTSAIHECNQEVWDKVQELCNDDLADFYLIDRMEEMGY